MKIRTKYIFTVQTIKITIHSNYNYYFGRVIEMFWATLIRIWNAQPTQPHINTLQLYSKFPSNTVRTLSVDSLLYLEIFPKRHALKMFLPGHTKKKKRDKIYRTLQNAMLRWSHPFLLFYHFYGHPQMKVSNKFPFVT